ncbi:AAA family ATPase [Devosia albogilva]|uniref:AAA family ATPase n=1 Tax=Devosia albogilva TaxID=429726 RepID=A0ABW5QJZ7_9HYPH
MAYKSIRPGQFFPKSFAGDNSMADWSIEYELIDKPTHPTQNITKTAKFTKSKWRRDDFPDRSVLYIEIQRTVPAGELTKFKRFLGPAQEGLKIGNLSENTTKYASAVLDKDISNYRVAHIEDDPTNIIYIGKHQGSDYSQFHFGAGEASIIATIDRIENAKDNSLVLIEEVENGLHPIAVRLFVQYLQNAARRKRLQVVFTTHSQDAIDEVPSEGIWASIHSNTWNGKLSIASLRAVTGSVPNEKVVFVEDTFVQEWVENALGRYGGEAAETTKVYPAGGYPNVVKVTEFHNTNPAKTVPAVGLVDGDIYDPAANAPLPEYCRFLGGGSPEATVFEYIYDNRVDLCSLIRQRCLLSAFDEERIVQEIESVHNGAHDPHVVFKRLSEKA